MKRVKTYLRSAMSQSRLKQITTINNYKDTLDKVELIDIAIEFVCGDEIRLGIFGNL